MENLALRQPLTVFKRQCPRPRLNKADRLFWVLLCKAWKDWRRALIIWIFRFSQREKPVVMIKVRLLLAALLVTCPIITHLARAADWPTFGRDPERSGWAFDESNLTVKNVSGLEVKWKTQVKNQPRALSALTAPVVASGVATPSGIKTLAYVAGTSNNIFAVDAETGDVIWSLVFEIHISPKDEDIFQC